MTVRSIHTSSWLAQKVSKESYSKTIQYVWKWPRCVWNLRDPNVKKEIHSVKTFQNLGYNCTLRTFLQVCWACHFWWLKPGSTTLMQRQYSRTTKGPNALKTITCNNDKLSSIYPQGERHIEHTQIDTDWNTTIHTVSTDYRSKFYNITKSVGKFSKYCSKYRP